MKKYIGISPLIISAFLTVAALAGEQDADKYLYSIMPNVYSIERESYTSGDFKSYFLSDKFEADFQKGNWSMGLEVLVDSVPVKLDGTADNERRKEFKEKIEKATSVKLSSKSKERIAYTIMDPEIYREWAKLIATLNGGAGFRVDVAESDAAAVFTITFTKNVAEVPWPVIKYIGIDGGIMFDSQARVGQTMEAPMILRAKRIEGADLLLSIETTGGAIVARSKAPEALKSATLPIGTVIPSVLPFDKFIISVGEKLPHDPARSKWAPADGRSVPSGDYVTLALTDKVPDLRGVFIRGLNTFDPSYAFPLKPGEGDPDSTRNVMSPQGDSLRAHSHQIALDHALASGRSSGGHPTAINTPQTITTAPAGGDETRPKNVALYHYIKIR